MGEGSRTPFSGSEGGCNVGGWWVAEDEELYKGAEEDYNRELA